MNYIKIRLTFNPGSKIYKKPLFLMQTQFPIVKFIFMDLLYRQNFLKEEFQSSLMRDIKT